MKAIKYLLAGAMLAAFTAPTMAQNVNPDVDAITKAIIANKTNPDAVKGQVKDFLKVNKKNADALAGLGRAYLQIKDTVNAEKYGQMAISKDKNAAAGYILLGDIAVVKNDGGEAAQWYNQAKTMDPKNPQGYIKYANIYRGRSVEQAVATLEELRSILPDYPVDAEAAHFYYLNNRFAKAKEYYDKVSTDKLDNNRLTEYALAAYFTSDSKKCLEVAQNGIQKYPRDAALNRLSFYSYTDLKDYANALKYADALFNKSDSAKFTARDYQYYGYAYLGNKEYDNAIAQFNKALEMNGELNDVRKQISEAYIAKNDYEKGLAMYDEYLKHVTNPKVSDYDGLAKLYSELANNPACKDKAGALKNADRVFGIIGEKFPNNLSYVSIMRARLNAQLDPETKEGLAKPYYEKYIELTKQENPDKPKLLIEPYSYLGYYYYLKNDKAQSNSYWNKILEIDPTNATAKQALGK